MELEGKFDGLLSNLKNVSAILMAEGMRKGGDPNKIVLGNAISVACAVYDVGELSLSKKLVESLQDISKDIQKLAEEGHPNLKGLTVKTGAEVFKDETSEKLFRSLLEEMTGIKIDTKVSTSFKSDLSAGLYIMEIKKKGREVSLKEILENGLNIEQREGNG